jgi:hypothetical protein
LHATLKFIKMLVHVLIKDVNHSSSAVGVFESEDDARAMADRMGQEACGASYRIEKNSLYPSSERMKRQAALMDKRRDVHSRNAVGGTQDLPTA